MLNLLTALTAHRVEQSVPEPGTTMFQAKITQTRQLSQLYSKEPSKNQTQAFSLTGMMERCRRDFFFLFSLKMLWRKFADVSHTLMLNVMSNVPEQLRQRQALEFKVMQL